MQSGIFILRRISNKKLMKKFSDFPYLLGCLRYYIGVSSLQIKNKEV